MRREAIISKMAIGGHPIHPMLIHFPVAALLGLVATDLAYIFSADPFWSRAGLWLSGVGAAGGWVSGFAGLIDLLWLPRVRNLVSAWCHAILAVMLLSLASFNWLMRWSSGEDAIMPWGLFASLLTALIIAITASFGGQLVYDHAVGVDTES